MAGLALFAVYEIKSGRVAKWQKDPSLYYSATLPLCNSATLQLLTMKKALDTYIRARYPLLWIVTSEEERALVEIEALAKEQKKRLLFWSGTTGLSNPAQPGRVDASKKDPLVLLTTILEDEDKCIWVLRDLHPYLRNESIVRRLREVLYSRFPLSWKKR